MENETVGFDDEDDACEVEEAYVDLCARDKDNEALLKHLDIVFGPLMKHCAETCTNPLNSVPLLETSPLLRPDPEQMRAQSLAALERFRVQGKFKPDEHTAGKRSARKGKDVVYIGFDAEWEEKSKGRNHVLSVQFHLIGPTGSIYEKVFDMNASERGGERMRLADALQEVLEGAEDEDVLLEWPREVVLVGFFTRADITVFSDFKQHLRPQLDGVGGTLASVKGTAKIALPLTPDRIARIKSQHRFVVGDDFDPKELSVRLIDARLFVPPGTNLSKLGSMIGLAKLELPEGYRKDQMSVFQRKDPEAFNRYGLRDAEIAVWFVLWVRWFSKRYLNLPALPATASGMAVHLAEKCMHEDGVLPDVALNFEKVELLRFDARTGLPRRFSERHPSPKRGWLEKFLADCYQGGRNECYWFGPTPIMKYSDPDLAGAYVTTLVELKTLDYDKVYTSTNLNDFLGDVAGFAEVAFCFPDGTAHPCLPVNAGERGLIFPRRGISLCTSPEIELAVTMGAEISIRFGYIIPWAERSDLIKRSQDVVKSSRRGKTRLRMTSPKIDVVGTIDGVVSQRHYRPFESFAIRIRDHRSKFRRKTLPFEFVKLLGNSLYGKTGQGFRDKRTFGPREMGSVKVGQSRVSEPAVAALVCGMVRAVVGEILARLPDGIPAVSCTTDGMIVGGELADLDLSGPICTRFRELVELVTPGMPMLENKHTVSQVVAMRTRGQLTGLPYGSEPIVLAKTSVRPPSNAADPNLWMVKLFADRFPGQMMQQESFISMRDQLTKGWDLQMERSEVKLNLEFDFKRKPVKPHLGRIGLTGVDHLAFDTEPWDTVDQAVEARMLFDGWRRDRCLKTLADFEDWQAYYSLQISNTRRRSAMTQKSVSGGQEIDSSEKANLVRGSQGGIYKTKRTGYVGIAVRAFLIAYSQRKWGLDGTERMTQAALSKWLTDQGYPTTLSAVKNASRSKLHDEAVPRTADVERFIDVACSKFPSLERDRFFIKPL